MTNKIRMIAAVSANGVIGLSSSNSLPFYYKADLSHFKKKTLQSVIIMGRNTFNSIGKTLPNRTNIVVSSVDVEGVETSRSLSAAVNNYVQTEDVWLIGGARIYREGMNLVDEIHLTLTPDVITSEDAVFFPSIDYNTFKEVHRAPLEGDVRLTYSILNRF
jgi:dihydrofolate reductase